MTPLIRPALSGFAGADVLFLPVFTYVSSAAYAIIKGEKLLHLIQAIDRHDALRQQYQVEPESARLSRLN